MGPTWQSQEGNTNNLNLAHALKVIKPEQELSNNPTKKI
jgi:hypothetical protein